MHRHLLAHHLFRTGAHAVSPHVCLTSCQCPTENERGAISIRKSWGSWRRPFWGIAVLPTRMFGSWHLPVEPIEAAEVLSAPSSWQPIDSPGRGVEPFCARTPLLKDCSDCSSPAIAPTIHVLLLQGVMLTIQVASPVQAHCAVPAAQLDPHQRLARPPAPHARGNVSAVPLRLAS